MRLLLILAVAILTACTPATTPMAEKPRPDPVTESWYGQAVAELAGLNRQAETRFREGNRDDAGTLVAQGQEVEKRLLAVPRPTLEAMQAASDLDDLYGRILIANKNVGWARLVYQKNLIRWTNWKPKSPDAERRRQQAVAGIAECDRRIAGGG